MQGTGAPFLTEVLAVALAYWTSGRTTLAPISETDLIGTGGRLEPSILMQPFHYTLDVRASRHSHHFMSRVGGVDGIGLFAPPTTIISIHCRRFRRQCWELPNLLRKHRNSAPFQCVSPCCSGKQITALAMLQIPLSK